MRFQALMPDVYDPQVLFQFDEQILVDDEQILHWLGITKIDRMLSMSK